MSETQRIMSAAQASEVVTDAAGRSIEVRRVTRRESMRLMRQWGAACNVQVWLGQAILASCARSIDGVPVPPPATPEAAEILVEKLDDAGLDAIGAWLQDSAEKSADAFKEAAKN